jgi:diguanylate cyclase (GGDEF)-like protein
MTSVAHLTTPSLVRQRLTQFRDAIEQLPDRIPIIPRGEEMDEEMVRLGDSILTLANRLAKRQQADEALAIITHQVVQGLYLEEILEHIYTGFRGLLPYDRIGCALLEENGTVLRARWARSEAPIVYLKQGYAANITGSSLDDLRARGRAGTPSFATRLILQEGVRSSLTCPLEAMGRPVGVLFFSSTKPFQYATMHTEMFEQLSGIISAAIEKSILYEQLSDSNAALRSARDALQLEASYDALTGIKNRRSIMQTTEELVSRGWRRPRQVALILLDIDHFKSVNDTFGHPGGDIVLAEVARRIGSAVRVGDEVGRYGGEEFLVCLDDISPEDLHRVATRILQSIRERPIMVGDQPVTVTASAGLAHRRDVSHETSHDFIQTADRHLYDAKASGRNCFVPNTLTDQGDPRDGCPTSS